MKQKLWTVFLTALLALCISFGLAACDLFGGDAGESGDNGDDTTIVIPGDPDDDPDTPGDPDEEPETPHEHTYTSAVTKEPTCTQEGEMTYTCTCGDSYTEPIAMTAHTEVIDEAVAPTCTQTGLTEGKHCSVCGTVLVEQEVIPMTAHTEVIDAAVAPSCTKTGLTEGKHCSVCDKILVEQQVIAMIAHSYSDEWTSDDEDHWHVCTECGARADIAAHIPDRDQPGENTPVKCTVCEYIIEPATGHVVHTAGDKWFSDGINHWQTCIGCGIKMNESAHSGGLATCISKAQCAVCNAQYGELAAHSPETIPAVAPTCTKTGLTEGLKCSVCGTVLVEQEVVPMTAHNYVGEETKKPTCEQEGEMTYTCTACGGSYTSSIPTIAHNYVDGVCTECGKPDESYATEGLVFSLSYTGTYYLVTNYTGSSKEVYIPSVYKGLPVKMIRYQAFRYCSGLTRITIPDSVTSIGEHAFYDCDSLTSITIPNSVTSIERWAFKGCSGLEGVYITDIVAWCAINFGGAFSNPLGYAHNLYLNGQLVTELVIPDNVTSIGDYAFQGCSSLTRVTFGDNSKLTSIGEYAFNGCEVLTSIKIPDSVTSIGNYAFRGCRGAYKYQDSRQRHKHRKLRVPWLQ